MAVIHDHARITAIQKPFTLQRLPEPLATPTQPSRKTSPVSAEYAIQTDWRSEAKRRLNTAQLPLKQTGLGRRPKTLQ